MRAAVRIEEEFKLCRPALHAVIYWISSFGYVAFAIMSLWFYIWSSRLTYAAWLGFVTGVMSITVAVTHGYDGYTFDDNSFGRTFYLDIWWVYWWCFWPQASLSSSSFLAFCASRRAAEKRTAYMERNLKQAIRDGAIRLLSVKWLLACKEDYVLETKARSARWRSLVIRGGSPRATRAAGRCTLVQMARKGTSGPNTLPHENRARLRFAAGLVGVTSRRIYGMAATPLVATEGPILGFRERPSKKRNAEDTKLFQQALKVMTYLYASPNTLVLQQKSLPKYFLEDLPTYENSGWCTMESHASGLQTEGGGKRYRLAGKNEGPGWSRLYASDRKSPEEMADIFADENKTKFVGKGDRNDVAKMYKTLHEELTAYDKDRKRAFIGFGERVIYERLGCMWMRGRFRVLRNMGHQHNAGRAFRHKPVARHDLGGSPHATSSYPSFSSLVAFAGRSQTCAMSSLVIRRASRRTVSQRCQRRQRRRERQGRR